MPTDPESPEDLVYVVFHRSGAWGMQTAFVQSMLQAGGIPVVRRGLGNLNPLLDPFELLVPRARLGDAKRLFAEARAAGPRAAEDAERASEGEFRRAGLRYPRSMAIEPDDSEDFDLVTVFSSEDHNSEMQAQAVQSVLEAGGIPAVIVGSSVLPNLPFEVRVPSSRVEEAEKIIADSEAVGPAGAEEAERASEEPR
jgi:hypothetical protein